MSDYSAFHSPTNYHRCQFKGKFSNLKKGYPIFINKNENGVYSSSGRRVNFSFSPTMKDHNIKIGLEDDHSRENIKYIESQKNKRILSCSEKKNLDSQTPSQDNIQDNKQVVTKSPIVKRIYPYISDKSEIEKELIKPLSTLGRG